MFFRDKAYLNSLVQIVEHHSSFGSEKDFLFKILPKNIFLEGFILF